MLPNGRLGEVTYIRGKTGKQPEYNQEAVEKLKTALESPDTSLAATTPDARLFVAQLVEAMANREQVNNEVMPENIMTFDVFSSYLRKHDFAQVP